MTPSIINYAKKQMAKNLLEATDISVKSQGQDALYHYLKYFGKNNLNVDKRTEVIEHLIALGCDIHAVDKNNRNLLVMAVRAQDVAGFKTLMKYIEVPLEDLYIEAICAGASHILSTFPDFTPSERSVEAAFNHKNFFIASRTIERGGKLGTNYLFRLSPTYYLETANIIKSCVARGIDINDLDSDGQDLLGKALEARNIRLVNILLNYPVKVLEHKEQLKQLVSGPLYSMNQQEQTEFREKVSIILQKCELEQAIDLSGHKKLVSKI